MGKTKTAFVGEAPEEKRSKFEKREHKVGEKVHISGLKGGQRIKVVETQIEPTPEEAKEEESASAKAAEKQRKPKVRGKKYQEAKTKIVPGKTYPLAEAVKLVKETSYSKFDGTCELHLVVKKAGISANVTLPHQAGREKKIEVASEATIKKISEGKIDFDVLLATNEMMPKLVPYARVLGPRGLMPNPKNGTIIKSEKDAAKFSGNTLNLKTEKEAPLIHTVIGKVNQDDKELVGNAEAIINSLGGGKQILKVYLKATMGPSVKVAFS